MVYCTFCKKSITEPQYLLLKDNVYKICPECAEIKKQDAIIISEIRFLPMSKDFFSTYEQVKEYLLYKLPDQRNKYYFMKSRMNCLDNSFVLFQYKGRLIGYAVCKQTVLLDEPLYEEENLYYGYYEFKEGSIKVFSTPITAEMFRTIDEEFMGFNQSHQRKPAGMLPAVFELIMEAERTSFSVKILEEIDEIELKSLKEGQKAQITVNAYERNPQARLRCLAYYRRKNSGKIKCEICGFDFGEVYGKEFEGTIHIHHIREISTLGEEYVIEAEKDLIPVCPNCHLVAHSRKPALSPEEIRKLIKNNTHLS